MGELIRKEVKMTLRLIVIGLMIGTSSAKAGSRVPTGLVCGSDAKVQYRTYHGEGPGCGESGHTVIIRQDRDSEKKTISVLTGWRPAGRGTPPYCHYWGPIYGGGSIDTYIGTWKVNIDGQFAGEYTYSEESLEDGSTDVEYTKHCRI